MKFLGRESRTTESFLEDHILRQMSEIQENSFPALGGMRGV
jgi:hypothetical protein